MWARSAAAAAAVVWLAVAGVVVAECPPFVCECRWKGGKQTVECVDSGLRTIPPLMDSSTQVLDVSGNNIQILPVHKFQRMGLTNLQRIFMSRCKIAEVDDHALLGLTNLVELDLSDNLLIEVPGRTFGDVPALMRLSLSGNPIRQLSRASFASLRELTTLELSRCELQTVEPGVFAELARLEWLRLDGNRLAMLDTDGLSLGLHGVDLHENPWRCDCRLRALRRWLVLYKVPPSVAPRCSGPPRLAGRVLRDMEERQLACLPDVAPSSMFLEVAEDQNVSLSCRVRAEPPANVTWSFNGQELGDAGAVFYRPYAISEYSEDGGRLRRSQLVVVNATDADQGVFRCRAANEAGVIIANYTLRVLLPPGSSSSESAPPQRAGYVAAVGASLAFLLVLLVIIVCVVVLRCARRRLRRGEAGVKAGVVNTGVDTPSSTCSMPKTIQMGTAALRAPAGGLADCREHVTYIGQRCCTSPSRRSADSNPDVVSDTEPTARRPEREPPAEPAYERIRPAPRLGPVWRPDEPAPLVHVDVHQGYGVEPGRGGTMGRSRSCHQQLAGPAPAGYRSLPRHRHRAESRRDALPPPPPELLQMESVSVSSRPRPPPPLRTSSAAGARPPLPERRYGEESGLVLQEVRPGRGLPSPPAGPLDSPPPLAPPAGFTDDETPLYSQVTRRPRGDPNTSGLPGDAPPPPPPPPGPVTKFSDNVIAAHASLHESPDEGYEESAADGTEV